LMTDEVDCSGSYEVNALDDVPEVKDRRARCERKFAVRQAFEL
jgi:hypothetical protein